MRRVFYCLFLTCFAHFPAEAGERVPAYLIRLPSSVTTAFVAETSAASFHYFENHDDNGVGHGGSSYMSIGQNGDGKQRSGDRRTPLGIYFVTEQLNTERMHEKYGVTAFTLDYPSTWDRRLQRTGDGIWVHGVDRRGGKRPPLHTDGCIALPNDELATMEDQFLPNVTPVVIARTVNWVDRDHVDAIRNELDTLVAQWALSLQRGDLHAFLSLHHDDFRHWEMNKDQWTAFHAEAFAERPVRKAIVSDVLLLGDPAEDGLYLSRFRLAVTGVASTVVLTKRLYWRRTAQGDLKVIAEDSG